MDGKIVYQVRVDSSRVQGDIAAAGEKINSGTATLVTLGHQAAERIGSALNTFFGSQNTAMSQMLSNLTGGFARLSGSAGSAAGSLSPLTAGIATLLGLDLSKLLSFFGKLPEAAAQTAAIAQAASGGSSNTGKVFNGNTVPGYRKGSDYIEKDKYALLHKGEAVLTAAENETLRALGGIEGASLMAAQKNAPVIMPREPAVPAVTELQPQNVNVTVELDGYQMAKVMATATNELNRQLNTRVIK